MNGITSITLIIQYPDGKIVQTFLAPHHSYDEMLFYHPSALLINAEICDDERNESYPWTASRYFDPSFPYFPAGSDHNVLHLSLVNPVAAKYALKAWSSKD